MPSAEQKALQLSMLEYYIQHRVDVERLGVGESYVMQYYLEQARDDIQTQLAAATNIRTVSALNTQISLGQRTIDVAYGQIAWHFNETLLSLAALEGVVVRKPFEVLGVVVGGKGLTQNQIRHLVDDTWIQGSPAAAWWKSQSATVKDRFARELRLGFAQGLSMQEIVERVVGKFLPVPLPVINPDTGRVSHANGYEGGVFSIARRDADAIVRTGIMAISEAARLDNLKEMSDVLSGVMWTATLDDRTTPICRPRDGKKYTLDGAPIGHTLPSLGFPPAHWRCRSTLTPVLLSWQQLGVSDTKIVDILKRWEARMERASMDGPVPESMTYEQWFAVQTETRQKDILGPRRWDLWKSHGLSFEEMIDMRGRPLTINQLKLRYGIDS